MPLKKTSPKPKKTSPKPRKTSPKPRKTSPKTRKTSRKTRKTSPKTRKTSPKTRKTSPKTRKTSPKTRKISPKTRKTSRKTRKTSPKTRKISPKTRKTSRKTIKTSRKTRKTSRKPRKSSPIIKQTKQNTVKNQQISPKISYTNGLIINKKRLSSISGPVSFHYLRPKKEVYNDGNSKYFPLIILFGDVHRSDINYCSPCTCNLQRKDCCYRLSDPSFLKLIDSMGNYGYTIDFYTETFFEGTGEGFKGGMMEEMTTGNIVTCYNRHLRNTRLDRCPTKNIRWQAGDVRASGMLIRDIYGGKNIQLIKSNKYLKNSYIEFQLNFIFILIKSYFIYQNDNKYYRYKLIEILPKTCFKNIDGFKKFLMNLFEGDNFDFKKFASKLFGMMNKDNSAIYKQVKKQTYGNFKDIKQWEDFYVRSLEEYILISFETTHSLKNIFMNLDKYLDNQIPITPTDVIDIQLISLYITVSLLDIYTIARIFKQPKGGNRSDLSFCYFGDAHIINIKRMLLSIGAYELVISKDENSFGNVTNRCLNFTDIKLDLMDELKKYK